MRRCLDGCVAAPCGVGAKGWGPTLGSAVQLNFGGKATAAAVCAHVARHPSDVRAVNGKGETAFVVAMQQGHFEAARAWCAAGADPNHVAQGDTVLTWAVREGRADVVKMALALNVTTEHVDLWGDRALHLAARHEAKGWLMTYRLLQAGADMEAVNQYGATPLLVAVSNGVLHVAQLLIDSGANVRVTDPYGETVLHYCARTFEDEGTLPEFMRRVALLGLSPRAPNHTGETAIEVAARLGSKCFSALMDARGAEGRWPPAAPDSASDAAAQRELERCRKMRLETMCARAIRRHQVAVDALPPLLGDAVVSRRV